MNILFINSAPVCPQAGGVERVTCELGKWLRQHHQVYSLALREGQASQEIETLFLPETGGWPTPVNLRALQELLEQHAIDIIIVQSETAAALELCTHADLSSCKVFYVLHSSPPTQRNRLEDVYGPCLFQLGLARGIMSSIWQILRYIRNRIHELSWERMRLQSYHQLCTSYITLSRTYFNELKRFGSLNGENKIVSIPNPAPMPDDHKVLEQKEKIVLWVGRMLFEQKRPDRMLRIWMRLSRDFPDWHIYLLGDGTARKSLETYCQRRNLTNIHFMGRVEPTEYYRRASILCMTSSYEGWPMTLVEAMSHGCAVVAYDSFSALEEIVQNGGNGFRIPAFNEAEYCDKLHALMSSPEACRRMGEAGLLTAQRYSLDTIGQQWERLFDEAMKK